MEDGRCDVVFRVILLGCKSVGKSTLMHRYAGEDSNNMMSTKSAIGVSWTSKVVNWKGTKIKLQLWTTAKQDKYSTLTSHHFSKADAIVFVFDVTNHSTFSGIDSLHEAIGISHQVEVVLVGNKMDQEDRRVISTERGQRQAKSFSKNGVPYFETSALNGENVNKVFNHILERLVHTKLKETLFEPSQVISLEVEPEIVPARRCC